MFLVSLERSWSVDNENGLALAIWTSVTQVMGKRRVGSQIASLTPDHKKSGIDLFQTSELRVRYVIGKISTRATSLVETSSWSDFAVESYELPKSRDSNRDNCGTISGLQLGSPGKKSSSSGRGVSCGPKCPWLVPTPKGVPECKLTTLWFVLDAESSLIY